MNAVDRLLGDDALARHGTRVALIGGTEQVTYAALAQRVRASAAALVALGLRPGDRVLYLMRDTPEFAAAWLGALHMGAVAVALNSKLTEAEYRHVLADSGAQLALVEDDLAQARPDLAAELGRDGRIAIAGARVPGLPDWREALRGAPDAPSFDAGADAPAFMLYSSGTTGKPKGIVHTHGSFAHVGGSFRRLGLGAGDRVLATSKLFFAYGLEHGLLAPLAFGASSILSAEWPTPESVLGAVERLSPSAIFSVPTLYRRLLAHPPARLANLRGIRRFVSAGEALSAQMVGQWRAATGGELLNLYGMSETFCACIVTPPGSSNGPRTGLPLEGVRVRLEGADGAEPPAGEAGVLWVSHPAQARSYASLPRESAEQFRDGWFCTRDLFLRDAEGFYCHQGRSDELVKIAGQWVRPAELEEVVAGVAGISDAACVAVADADGLERLALFVAVSGAEDGAMSGAMSEALRAAADACERALPRHKRPKWLRAVGELPRTATGKVQRFKLREILRAEVPPKR